MLTSVAAHAAGLGAFGGVGKLRIPVAETISKSGSTTGRRHVVNVNSVCNHNVAMIEANTGIVEAAARMRTEHVGDLIVVEHRGARRIPIGILTDRDIVVSIVGSGAAPGDLTVADAMTRDPLTVHIDNGIEYALREMSRAGVRRTPVVDGSGDLIGVLSIDDIIDQLAVQLGYISDILRLGQQAELRKRP